MPPPSSSEPTAAPAPVFSVSTPDMGPSPPATPDVIQSSPPPLPWSTNLPSSRLPSPPCHPPASPVHSSQTRARARSRTPPLSLRPPYFAPSMMPQSTRRRLRLRRSLSNAPIATNSRNTVHNDSSTSLPPWAINRHLPSNLNQSNIIPNGPDPLDYIAPPRPSRAFPGNHQIPMSSINNGSSALPPPHPFAHQVPSRLPNSHPPSQSHISSLPINPPRSEIYPPSRPEHSTIDDVIAVLERRSPLPNVRNVISRTYPGAEQQPSFAPSYTTQTGSPLSVTPTASAPSNSVSIFPQTGHNNMATSPGLACIPAVQPIPSRTETRPSYVLQPPAPSVEISGQSATADRTRWQRPYDTSGPDLQGFLNQTSNSGQTSSPGVPQSLWPIPSRDLTAPHTTIGPVQRGISPMRSPIRPIQLPQRVPRNPPIRDGSALSNHLAPVVPSSMREVRDPTSELDVALAAAHAAAADLNRYGIDTDDEHGHHNNTGAALESILGTSSVPSVNNNPQPIPHLNTLYNGGGMNGQESLARRAVSFNLNVEGDGAQENSRRISDGVTVLDTLHSGHGEDTNRERLTRFLRMTANSRRLEQVSDDMRIIFGDEDSGISGDTISPIGQRSSLDRAQPTNGGIETQNTADAIRAAAILPDDDNDIMMVREQMRDYLYPLHTMRGRGRGGYGGGLRGRAGLRAAMAARIPRSPVESMLRRAEVRAMVVGREFGVPCGLFEYSVRGRPSLTPNIDWPEVILITDENVKPRAPILDLMSENNVQWCVRIGPLGNGEGDGRRGYQGFVHGLMAAGFAVELNVTGGIIYLWALDFPTYGECLLGVFRPTQTNS